MGVGRRDEPSREGVTYTPGQRSNEPLRVLDRQDADLLPEVLAAHRSGTQREQEERAVMEGPSHMGSRLENGRGAEGSRLPV